MNIITQLKDKNEINTLYLFAFLIPIYPKLYTLSMLLFVAEVILKTKPLATHFKRNIQTSSPLLWMILFFVLHLFGSFYSTNTSFAWMDIGMKISFFFIPVIFIFFPIQVSWKKFMFSFFIGALASVFIAFSVALYHYFETGNDIHFKESYLSHWMHRSYWASYLTIGFLISFKHFLWRASKVYYVFGIVSLLFFMTTLLTGSKMGIITLFVVAICLLLIWIVTQRKWIPGLIILVVLCGSSIFVAFKSPILTQRIAATNHYLSNLDNLNVNSTESNTTRIFMWRTATELIQENWLIGTGTGDIKDELQKRNYEKGYVGVADKKFNVHNQYLQTFATLGLFGLITLIAMLFLPLFKGRETSTSYSLEKKMIILILILSLIPESFFETQAGIVPGAFLLSIIGSYQKGE
jgi:O-antigen ligase